MIKQVSADLGGAFWETRRLALAGLLLCAGFLTYLTLPHASLWFEVDDVYVADAAVGSVPVMKVDRTIHLPFRGRWTATVMRKGPLGFYTFCTANGENDYSPSSELPPVVDLNWWTWPTKCELPPGTYQLRTLWTIYPPLFPAKEIRSVSNEFTVSGR